ncbi:MAG: phage tail tape measure protein [Deltaproteobacteria bacterium]|nr:phage tail tape measure protein [Deltaproteobacteria bacterium]
MSVSSVAIQFTIVDALSKGVSAIKDRLHALSGASKEVKRDFDRMAASFKYAAITGLATRELYKGMKPAIGLAGDLQQEMLGVKAELMGAGKDARQLAEELKAIKSTAFDVQSWTPFDMTQIAALEKELIKAGASVEDITGKTGAAAASAALAVYERLDPVSTGKALIGISTPFKITAAGFMDLADTISRAASASTVGAAEIAESAKYAAGPMSSLGKSSKEMLALSAVMAQVGIQGSQAGVALKEFFLEAAKQKIFRDAKGSLLPTIKIIETMREKLKGMGEAQKSEVLGKVFGERGMQAALALLNDGKGSYKDIAAAMEQGISLQEKLNESMSGFNNQMLALKGTFRSTIADLYQPALPILTAIVAKTNELVSTLGRASQKNETIGKAATGLSFTGLGLGAAAALALGGAGVFYGRKVLKGTGGVGGLLKGVGSDAAGIAKGKAVEAATGVTPVFVTNWPATGYAGSNAADALKSVGGLKKLPFGAVKNLLTMGGAIGWGTGAGGVVAAGAGGWAIGTALNSLIDAIVAKTTGEDKGLGGVIYDWLHGEAVKNEIKVNVLIDKDGNQRVMTEEKKTPLNRGNWNGIPTA